MNIALMIFISDSQAPDASDICFHAVVGTGFFESRRDAVPDDALLPTLDAALHKFIARCRAACPEKGPLSLIRDDEIVT